MSRSRLASFDNPHPDHFPTKRRYRSGSGMQGGNYYACGFTCSCGFDPNAAEHHCVCGEPLLFHTPHADRPEMLERFGPDPIPQDPAVKRGYRRRGWVSNDAWSSGGAAECREVYRAHLRDHEGTDRLPVPSPEEGQP